MALAVVAVVLAVVEVLAVVPAVVLEDKHGTELEALKGLLRVFGCVSPG